MKVSQQSPVLPTAPSTAAAPVAEVAKPEVAAPITEAQTPAQRPARPDHFGGNARTAPPQGHAEILVSYDPVTGAGNTALEKFLKGMGPTVHVVKPGDTLTGIARASYPASYAHADWVTNQIALANGLENPNLIKVGQALELPGLYTYTVQSGDTLGKIASISENALADIVALNGIENPDLIRVGQELVLEGPLGQAWQMLSERLWLNAEDVIHSVKPGDTLSNLVREYFPYFADSPEWIERLVPQFAYLNGIENPDLIHVGQKLRVPGLYTYEAQEGDTLWSLTQPLGDRKDPIRDADGKLLTTDPKPGDKLQVHVPDWH